jgi:hypothetical protein
MLPHSHVLPGTAVLRLSIRYRNRTPADALDAVSLRGETIMRLTKIIMAAGLFATALSLSGCYDHPGRWGDHHHHHDHDHGDHDDHGDWH